MIENKCSHKWKKHTDATRQMNVGAIPAFFICEKCNTELTSGEVFQLEALENQAKELRYLTGFQRKTVITTICISFLALIISIFALVMK